MFPTAEMELDFNEAVQRGDREGVRNMIVEADKYAKEQRRKEKIDNMINMAVMTGLGIAAGSPGTYGDFGTQVARGALVGINQANALENTQSLDDYRRGQLENSRAKALNYQRQLEQNASRGQKVVIKHPVTGESIIGHVNPFTGQFAPDRDENGNLLRAPSTYKVVQQNNGDFWRVLENTANQVTANGQPLRGSVFMRGVTTDTGQLGQIGPDGTFTGARDEQGRPVFGKNPDYTNPDASVSSISTFRTLYQKLPAQYDQALTDLETRVRQNPTAYPVDVVNRELARMGSLLKDWLETPPGRAWSRSQRTVQSSAQTTDPATENASKPKSWTRDDLNTSIREWSRGRPVSARELKDRLMEAYTLSERDAREVVQTYIKEHQDELVQ